MSELQVEPMLTSLAGLAEIANAEHERVGRSVRQALGSAITAGDALLAARDQVGSGWTAWVKENINYGLSTASRYMRLAAHN